MSNSNQAGFNAASQTATALPVTLASPDGSVTINSTVTGYTLAVDLCQLVASAPDNGLTIGG